MGIFPFNNDKHSQLTEPNGSPLKLDEAVKIARQIMRWHCDKETADWTQSNDGHEDDVIHLAFGLMSMLSDPNHIRHMQIIGADAMERCKLIADLRDIYSKTTSKDDKNFDVLIELGIIKEPE